MAISFLTCLTTTAAYAASEPAGCCRSGCPPQHLQWLGFVLDVVPASCRQGRELRELQSTGRATSGQSLSARVLLVREAGAEDGE